MYYVDTCMYVLYSMNEPMPWSLGISPRKLLPSLTLDLTCFTVSWSSSLYRENAGYRGPTRPTDRQTCTKCISQKIRNLAKIMLITCMHMLISYHLWRRPVVCRSIERIADLFVSLKSANSSFFLKKFDST